MFYRKFSIFIFSWALAIVPSSYAGGCFGKAGQNQDDEKDEKKPLNPSHSSNVSYQNLSNSSKDETKEKEIPSPAQTSTSSPEDKAPLLIPTANIFTSSQKNEREKTPLKPLEENTLPEETTSKPVDLIQYQDIPHAGLVLKIPNDIMKTAIKKDSSIILPQVCRLYLLREKEPNTYVDNLRNEPKTLVTSKRDFQTMTARMLLDIKEKGQSFSSVQNTDAIIHSLELFFEEVSKSIFAENNSFLEPSNSQETVGEKTPLSSNPDMTKMEIRFGRSEEDQTCNILFQNEKGSILIWAPYPYKLKLK